MITAEQFWTFAFIFMVSTLVGAILWNYNTQELEKPDGLVYIAINGEIVQEIKVGHDNAINFCQRDNVNPNCQESFVGCGAFNCYCDFNSSEIGLLKEQLKEMGFE